MSEYLRPLLDAAPDAVVVVGHDGRILLANGQATAMFGYAEDELVGASVEMLLPESLRHVHVGHRTAYVEHPVSRPMAAGQNLHARHRDGHSIPVDIALGPVTLSAGPGVAAFVRDATIRRNLDEHRQRVREAELARAQARELNDSIVQGLTAVAWLLEEDAPQQALAAVRETLASARSMMRGLFSEAEREIAPGELRRVEPARRVGVTGVHIEPVAQLNGRVRVVVADDSEDVRMLLRLRLGRVKGIEVVDEVVDGAAAVAAVESQNPDVVLLDLSMPVMDGFEAAQVLRDRFPTLRIVVLSGHPGEQMRDRALACGADGYIEKGGDFDEIVAAIKAASPTA